MLSKNTKQRLAVRSAGLLLFLLLFLSGTVALLYARLETDTAKNAPVTFAAGEIKLNLNDGKPVIETYGYIFEPGLLVQREFFLENNGNMSAFYRIYLEDVAGDLADLLLITIKDGNDVVCSGTANELRRDMALPAPATLQGGERRTLTALFYLPFGVTNDAQNRTLTFTLCADASQTTGNPNRLF